ncbi:MAG: hypothetical protein IPQ07_11360 [Myxococcales bacterium]|nr:hypothetical protein [Myxococcales bacterium]
MSRLVVASSLVAVLTLTAARDARADLRSFTHTYEYSTVPEGKTAVELWHTQGRATWDKTSPQFYEQILELEHGITDHWDAAFYTVFSQVAGDAVTSKAFGLEAVKLESRYRFADRGEWPVDTLVYVEVAKDFGASVYELEGKVIVARDFDKFTAAANAIGEVKVGNDTVETELELGWAAGLTYQAHPKFKLGAETWGQLEESELYLSVGPAMSFAPSSNFWLTLTTGFGLTDEAEAFSARAIIGIEL